MKGCNREGKGNLKGREGEDIFAAVRFGVPLGGRVGLIVTPCGVPLICDTVRVRADWVQCCPREEFSRLEVTPFVAQAHTPRPSKPAATSQLHTTGHR